MKKPFYATALTAFLLTTLLLTGCADPASDTPDAKVTEPASEIVATPEGTTYTITPASTLGFVGSKVTGSHEGGFKAFSGTVTIPDGDLAKTTINVSIDMKSTFSDADNLTKHLLSADFFEADTFPESTFVSTGIASAGDAYTITGNLTLHGVTKSISFPATMSLDGGAFKANAEFDINRFDFDIKYPGKVDDLIRENVVIKLAIEAGA